MSIPKLLRRNLSSATAHRAAAPEVAGPKRQDRGRPDAKKILFASAHSVVDFSNGASVATLNVLERLAEGGFDCQAFCATKLDFQNEVCVEDVVDAMGEPHQLRGRSAGSSERGCCLRGTSGADHAHPPGINPNRSPATRRG